jgi:hypothetical protein
MNTLLDKLGGTQKPSLPLGQSPPLAKRTVVRRVSVPILPPSLWVPSAENSPHRSTPALGTAQWTGGASQLSPTQISPFPLLSRRGSEGFPTPVDADGELEEVALS